MAASIGQRSARRANSAGFIATSAAQSGIVLGVVLVRLRHQSLNVFAQAVGFLTHIAIAHGFVPRGVPLHFRPIGCHIAQLHQPRLARHTQYLGKDVAKGLQMQLTKVTDGPKSGRSAPTIATKARLRSQACAILRLENTPTHRRTATGTPSSPGQTGSPPSFILIRCIETAQIQLGHHIEQVEDHIASLAAWRQALSLPVALGFPGRYVFLWGLLIIALRVSTGQKAA